jgi:hypothetical protein
MNKETKKMVMGFIEYLQSIYGSSSENGGASAMVKPVPPNSLAIPLFLTEKTSDSMGAFGMVGNAMGMEKDYSTGDPNDLLSAMDSLMGLSPGISGGMPSLPMANGQQDVDPLQQMMMGM